MARRTYEIIYDAFHKRWVMRPQGLPGALKVSSTQEGLVELAVPICNNSQPCLLRVYGQDGKLQEERSYGKGG